MHAPTISTIESTAPTSWKFTCVRRQPVNLAFRHGEPLEDRHRLLFHPIGELALGDQLPDLSEGAAMFVRVGVAMRVPVWSWACGSAPWSCSLGQVHIELHPFEAGLASARDVQVIAFEPQLLELLLQLARIHPQVNQRGDKHIAADAAAQIEVKRSSCYPSASALIWLAA